VHVAGKTPALVVDSTTLARVYFGDEFIASKSPEFRNEDEPYVFAIAADSDDDRPFCELIDSNIEMLHCVIADHQDPRVHAQASSPSPPCIQQHALFPACLPIVARPQAPLVFFSILSLSFASHFLRFSNQLLSFWEIYV
jgi:hypothetical protein